ncbi:MAG: hypothetical protein Q8O55_06530 [Dehalococcoidales bacterium]|nr:hypothetical protein [Dehalococcoidales bacterium]
MSKFVDRLNQLARGGSTSLGFLSQKSASLKPKIQLVVSLAQEDSGEPGALAGADAGLLRISKPTAGGEALRKIAQAIPEIPWGVRLEGGWEKTEEFTKAGADFIVFSTTSTPLTIIEAAEAGKILELEPSISDGLLRTVNELPVNAVLIAGEQEESKPLTWQNLMLFQRFALLLNKPLLVPVPAKVTAGELKTLWEAGVSGAVIEAAKQTQDGLKKLRQEIDKLEFSSPRRRERREALLPRIARETSPTKEEEEEEEEE